MNIRKAGKEDLERAYELVCLLEGKQLDKEGFEQAYDYALNRDLMYVLEEEKVLAFMHMRASEELCRASKICEILELVVEEGYRNRGYGAILLNKALEYCKDEGIGIIQVLSSSYREDAHRFYEKHGFAKTGYRFFNKDWKEKTI